MVLILVHHAQGELVRSAPMPSVVALGSVRVETIVFRAQINSVLARG
jgi:hypothetical protein